MTDVQVAAIEQLARTFDFGHGVRHSRKVAALATSLFDQLSFRGLIPALMPEERRLLTAAALAHDIGASPIASIDTQARAYAPSAAPGRDHHGLLSCHLLCDAANEPQHRRLAEIDPGDWSALLHCVLWHEGDPHTRLWGEPPAESWRVRPLAGILRLAEALDCDQRCVVVAVQLIGAPAWLRVLVRSTCPCDTEVAAAQQNSDVLAEAIDLKIAVQQIVEEDSPAENPR